MSSAAVVLFVLLLSNLPAAAGSATEVSAAVQEFNAGRLQRAERLASQELARAGLADVGAAKVQAHLVRALVYERRGRLDEALAEWSIIHGSGSMRAEVGVLAQVSLGRLAAALGRCVLAAEQAGGLPPESVFRRQLWARASTCAIRQRNQQLADSGIAELLQFGVDERARVIRARASLLRRDFVAAAEDLHWVAVYAPHTAAAREASVLQGQWKRRGFRGRRLTLADRLHVADELRARQLSARAASVLSGIRRRSAKKATRQAQAAELGLIEIGMVDQQYTSGLGRVEKLVWARDIGIRARARFIKADLLARLGRPGEALRLIETLLRRADLKEDAYTLEAALLALRLADANHYPNRVRRYAGWILNSSTATRPFVAVDDDGVQRRRSTLGDARGWALWYLANNERRTGAATELVDGYLADISSTHPLAATAQYWRARLAVDHNDEDGARILVADYRERFSSVTYYGVLVEQLAMRLGVGAVQEVVQPLGLTELTDVGSAAALAGRMVDTRGIITLARLGLRKQARQWLKTLPVARLSVADKVSAAWLYRLLDEPVLATQVARMALNESVVPPSALLVGLGAPQEFPRLVADACAERQVPPSLVWAIMREESGFDRRARSPRNARGLMQMIPPTARRVARAESVRRFRLEQLMRPEMSIRLGAAYIAELLQRFDNRLVLAIAAYHAGAAAVERWVSQAETLRADIFVESIPYSSTRAYVKRVLPAFALYQRNPRDLATALALHL